ncbi:hypothetical protein IV203_008460 [Nitzschia inconspicua]|uniref:Uncharacterized protein n=1 Tax=Nitzschia inconspicua TaxID=303405 RepID=A0A9K3KZ48_9STRA|nr:hypothetical protein IV203_008460 [Nitzschia inconspicua]
MPEKPHRSQMFLNSLCTNQGIVEETLNNFNEPPPAGWLQQEIKSWPIQRNNTQVGPSQLEHLATLNARLPDGSDLAFPNDASNRQAEALDIDLWNNSMLRKRQHSNSSGGECAITS